jgi:hypothetical protein
MLRQFAYFAPETVALHVDIAVDLWYNIYNVRGEVTLKLRN